MKRVLALTFSRSTTGYTLQAVKKLVDKISSSYAGEVELVSLTPKQYTLLPSQTPEQPFLIGEDAEVEAKDDTLRLKEAISSADLVILASPTYYAMVSYDAKLFIDRFCHLAHLFYWAGKPVITVVTADGNGAVQTSAYFKKFIDGLGMVRIAELLEVKAMPLSEEAYLAAGQKAAAAFEESWQPSPNGAMEAIFQSWKSRIVKYPKDNSEYQHWKNTGLFDCDTIRDYFSKL